MLASRRSARDVALAATLHDPTGALAADVGRALPRLLQLYGHVAVATSPPTAARMTSLLAAAGVHAGTPAANLRGPLYRLSLRRALAGGTSRVHYLDFDRALRWVTRAPRELAAVLRLGARSEVLLLGRTAAAHRSHHLPLWATEVLANRLMADRLGLDDPLDLLVPSFVLARERAVGLLARSRARDAGIYGEWAALVVGAIAGVGATSEVAYLECRGLDWETPDRHRRAVRRIGLAAWRRRQQTPREWALRVELASAIVARFDRTLGRWPVAMPSIRRLPTRVGDPRPRESPRPATRQRAAAPRRSRRRRSIAMAES